MKEHIQEVAVVRDAEIIANEILQIKSETFRILDSAVSYAKRSAFEIGKRLIEAKAMVPAGEWLSYLQETLDYSVDTAENLMRIAREFDIAAVPQFGDLNYGQMVAMFALPVPERKELVEKQDVSKMSVREIKKLIKEKEEAEQAAKDAKQSILEQQVETESLRNDLLIAQKRMSEMEISVSQSMADRAELEQLKKEADKDAKQIEKLRADNALQKKKIADLKANPEKIEVAVNDPTPERMKELKEEAEARIRAEYDAKIEDRVREAIGQAEREKAMEDPRFVEINVALTQIQNLVMCVGTNFNQLRDEKNQLAENLSDKLERFFDRILSDNFGFSVVCDISEDIPQL